MITFSLSAACSRISFPTVEKNIEGKSEDPGDFRSTFRGVFRSGHQDWPVVYSCDYNIIFANESGFEKAIRFHRIPGFLYHLFDLPRGRLLVIELLR